MPNLRLANKNFSFLWQCRLGCTPRPSVPWKHKACTFLKRAIEALCYRCWWVGPAAGVRNSKQKKKKIDEKERPRGAGLTAYLTRWLPSSELHRPGDPLPSLASSRSRSRGDQESSPRLPDRPGGNTPLLPVSNTLPRDSA
jgi:hypothetical protein